MKMFSQLNHGKFVLIETYWNVNILYPSWLKMAFSINRNILECKYTIGITDEYLKILVLIETYWNVNVIINHGQLPYMIRINRNILECKSDA